MLLWTLIFIVQMVSCTQELEQVELLSDNGLFPDFPAIAEMANSGSLQPNSIWPEYPNFKLSALRPKEELRDMLRDIDSNHIQNTISKLVSFGTRHTMSNQTDPNRGIGAARDWIVREMAKYANTAPKGRMSVAIETYEQEATGRISKDTQISNIVATIRGSSDPDRTYVILAHYDSINSDIMDHEGDAPGANDNASGVAVVMELCRIIAARKTQPKATILFATVAGEEQGLFGSNALAKSLKQRGADVQGVLNNDIVGSPVGPNGERQPRLVRLFAQGLSKSTSPSQVQQISQFGEENDSMSRQLARYIYEVAANNQTGMNVQIIYRTERYGRSGDQMSFLNEGFPAIRFVEPAEDFTHQHQKPAKLNGKQIGDLIEFIDSEYVARVAKVNMAALWSLSNAPGLVRKIRVKAQWINSMTNITFTNPNGVADGSITGCELVWRPTILPRWTNTHGVKACTGYLTTSVSQDNVIFGVRAVGANGYKGPIAAASSFA